MLLRNTKDRFGVIAKSFHWIIALLIICMLAIGFIMTSMAMSPDKVKLVGLHKSIGATILILATIRLLWKAANVAPLLPAQLGWLEKFAAHAGHAALYVLMFAMPLTGWAMSSAAGYPVSVFGLFTLPNIVAPDKDLKEILVETHDTLAWTLIIVVTLHLLAALAHHFYYKDNVLLRMLPFGKPTEERNAENAVNRAGR